MILHDLPELVTLDYLEEHGMTQDDVSRRCPGAVEHGHAQSPYWHRDDLAPLLVEEEEGDEL